MRCRLYNAAGNRILWLCHDGASRSADFPELRSLGLAAVRDHQFGQELTAVLFGCPGSFKALFWNQDDTAEDICGNALRCLADFLTDDPLIAGPDGQAVCI